MNLLLKTTLRLTDTPETQSLIDLLRLEFEAGRYEVRRGGGVCHLTLDLDISITLRQKKLFLDVMRTLDTLMLDTVYVTGYAGDEPIGGYMGPDRRIKERSRARLETIRGQVETLLPEHRIALLAMLSAA